YAKSYSTLAFLAPPRKDGYAWFCYVLEGVVGRYHIATRSFTFFTSKTQPALPFDKVKSIAYDAYGDVWIAGHSLSRWNNQTGNFDTLISVYGGTNKFNDNILTISADAKGSLWLHNAENGLLEYRIKEKKFIAYTLKDGLPSMVLQCFSPVVENILWMGSPNHLTRFNTETKKSLVYDYHDGFPDESPDSRRIFYDSGSRKFYMFCNDYLVEFPLFQKIYAGSSSDLLIQEVMVNNKKYFFHPPDTIRLKYYENTLALQFNIIDFESPNSYQFAYRFNNAETWTVAAQERIINMNGLQPGKYVLQLKASGKYGDEKIKEFTIFIKPPFWKTTWFLLTCGLFLASLIYILYQRRIKTIRKRANIDKLLAQTEMKALHAQMNPHFIFNSLNSIREMILSNNNKEASHFLSKFAHLMRVTLDHSSHSYVSLRNTIDYLNRYMEMEQIRNSHFTCRIHAENELDPDETILPPMLIQPFIENAIWHGITGSAKNININIDFKKEDDQLVCLIDDNGIGIEQSLKNKNESGNLHSSVGIKNIKNRIRLLNEKYNLQSSITIEDKANLPGYHETGTLVTLRLPLEITDK
ncbi:MAG: histidine kinase, partial [Bacteroidota bacterium]